MRKREMHGEAPRTRGSYLLIARLAQPAEVAVGRLGSFHFPAGCYAYTGSALGPGGIRARLARHRRPDKRRHWHIDHLLQVSVVEAAWYVASVERLECAWAAALASMPGHQQWPSRFGASDCRCPGHLVYCPVCPTDQQVAEALQLSSGLHQSPVLACRPYVS